MQQRVVQPAECNAISALSRNVPRVPVKGRREAKRRTITEKLNKFSCNPVFMKMHGEVFAFVPRNPILSRGAALLLAGRHFKAAKNPPAAARNP